MKVLSENELSKLKNIELNMLCEIDKICREYQIRYSIAAGTLLGAARHKGFIPWDDDIDIMMYREDYCKLKECITLYSKELYWVDYYTYEGYPYPFSKIMKKNTIFIEESNKYATAPNGVFIDVFPIDNTEDNFMKRKKQYQRVMKWKQRLVTRENYYFGQTGIKELYRKVRKNIYNLVPKNFFIKKIDKECFQYSNTNILISLTGTLGVKKVTFPRAWFENYIELEFEGSKFMAIGEYKKYLELTYGDYMKFPPRESQVPHHFVYDIHI